MSAQPTLAGPEVPPSCGGKGPAVTGCGCSFCVSDGLRSLAVGDPVEVQFPTGWEPATFTGWHSPTNERENFQRIDLILPGSRRIEGAHPRCVRPVTS